jgi:hypothetical protein
MTLPLRSLAPTDTHAIAELPRAHDWEERYVRGQLEALSSSSRTPKPGLERPGELLIRLDESEPVEVGVATAAEGYWASGGASLGELAPPCTPAVR